MPENVEYRKDSLPPMESIKLHTRTVDTKVSAIGYGMTKPSIEIEQTWADNKRTRHVSISGHIYDEFMEYLRQADKHWGIKRE